jgi:hypothetical protein
MRDNRHFQIIDDYQLWEKPRQLERTNLSRYGWLHVAWRLFDR